VTGECAPDPRQAVVTEYRVVRSSGEVYAATATDVWGPEYTKQSRHRVQYVTDWAALDATDTGQDTTDPADGLTSETGTPLTVEEAARYYAWALEDPDPYRRGFATALALAARQRPTDPADGLAEALFAWADDQMQALPEHRTPVAHGKAELLTDLRNFLAARTPADP
jgi:hypothetical protein